MIKMVLPTTEITKTANLTRLVAVMALLLIAAFVVMYMTGVFSTTVAPHVDAVTCRNVGQYVYCTL